MKSKQIGMGLALSLGIAIGTSLGIALDNLGLGIALGVAIGSGLGAAGVLSSKGSARSACGSNPDNEEE